MDHIDSREDENVLIDLGAVTEETKGSSGDAFEQDEPIFRPV